MRMSFDSRGLDFKGQLTFITRLPGLVDDNLREEAVEEGCGTGILAGALDGAVTM